MKIISVHTPKAGGTSVKTALAKAFGQAFNVDYADDPANPISQRQLDPDGYMARNRYLPDGIRCLHGHFHPGQFNLDNVFLFTLLRHPVDNLISIYFFWKSLPPQGQPLHDFFLARNLSIIEMAKLPLLRYLYSRTYFGGFDMTRFTLIGRHEDRTAALYKLSQFAGVPIDTSIHENATETGPDRETLLTQRGQREELHDILIEDIQFYDRFCA